MNRREIATYSAVIIIAIAIDQIAKLWVETQMGMHETIPLLPFFALFRTHNTGIAFSMFSSFGPLALIGLTIGVIVLISLLAVRTRHGQRFARFGYALIIGGAIGNLIDRSMLGYVVDYFLFHTQSWSFAVFNLADAFISIGAGFIILQEVIDHRRSGKPDLAAETGSDKGPNSGIANGASDSDSNH